MGNLQTFDCMPSVIFQLLWMLLLLYRVYLAGSKGPLLFCLHGGGYTGMTWAVCAQQLAGNGYKTPPI